MSLVKEIAKMELGDILVIKLMYENKWSEEMNEITTELAKTRWMDSYTYILGGIGDDIVAIPADNPEDLDGEGLLYEAQKVVDKIFETRNPSKIDFSNDGYKVEIHAYGGCLRPIEIDNMIYHK